MSVPAIFARDDVIYRMVRIPEVDDSLKLGWAPLQALDGTHHGYWSVLMFWVCACGKPMRVPLGVLS